MLRSWRALPVLLLLAADVALGAVASRASAVPQHLLGVWLIGITTAVLLLIPRPQAGRPATRLWAWIAPLGLFVAGVAVAMPGAPLDATVGNSLTVVVQSVVTVLVLRSNPNTDPDGRPALRRLGDLATWVSACALSALVGAALAATASVITDVGTPGGQALSYATVGFGSQLAVVPLLCRLPAPSYGAGALERVLQWCVLIAMAAGVFGFGHEAPVLFLALPALAWGALRLSTQESLGQLFAVYGIAIAGTAAGWGPLASVHSSSLPQIQAVLLAAFIGTCALMVVPLTVQVAQLVEVVREVRRERDLVAGIVQSASSVAIIATGPDNLITLFNPGAEKILGYRAADMVGTTTEVMFPPEAMALTSRELGWPDDPILARERLSDGHHQGTPVRIRRADGVLRMHAFSLTELKTSRGEPNGWLITSEDITDRVAQEKSLQDALAAERDVVERLREVDAVKDKFVSTVSHELRTPITSILGYLEMLRDGSFGELSPLQLDALVRVSGNSQRLLTLIEDLLVLSSINERGIEFDARPLDLCDVVRGGRELLVDQLRARPQLTVDWRLPEAELTVSGEAAMLERVVVNLVSNAIKFTPDTGTVDVQCVADRNEVLLTVTDAGCGIPADEQEQLFSRFFRTRRTVADNVPGTGLGLSISKSIVEQHGGTITAHSEVGHGTRLEVRLPLVTERRPVREPRPGRRPSVH